MHARAQTPRAMPNRAGRFLSPVYSEYRALRTLYTMLHLSTLNRITGLLYSFTLTLYSAHCMGYPIHCTHIKSCQPRKSGGCTKLRAAEQTRMNILNYRMNIKRSVWRMDGRFNPA